MRHLDSCCSGGGPTVPETEKHYSVKKTPKIPVKIIAPIVAVVVVIAIVVAAINTVSNRKVTDLEDAVEILCDAVNSRKDSKMKRIVYDDLGDAYNNMYAYGIMREIDEKEEDYEEDFGKLLADYDSDDLEYARKSELSYILEEISPYSELDDRVYDLTENLEDIVIVCLSTNTDWEIEVVFFKIDGGWYLTGFDI
jgi:hypothetical protein